MPIQIQICGGLAEVTMHGKLTVADLRQLIETGQELEAQLAVTPDRIVRMADVCLSEVTIRDWVAFAEKRSFAPLKNKVKTAIVAPEPEQYGFARMFMVYNRNPDIEVMLFKDAAGAYRWLGREAKTDDTTSAPT